MPLGIYSIKVKSKKAGRAMQQAAQTAVWYDGKSAAEHMVRVFHRPYSSEIRICSLDQINDVTPLSVWKISSTRILSGKLSSFALTLRPEPDDGQRLVFSEKEAIDAVSAWMGSVVAGHKKNRLRRWLLGTASIWGVCILLYLGSTTIFSFLAQVIPQKWEESLGRSSRESVIAMLKHMPGAGMRGLCDTGSESPDLQGLVNRLAEGAPNEGYSFDLIVLDADFVNAFALPGGYMVVSTGLIKECASADELAGVIAHEMAHVTERHGTGGMLRQYAWESFLRMMGVNDSMSGAIANLVLTSSFSRDDERAADAKGVERLIGAGINPMSMADFFGTLAKDEEEGSVTSLLSYVSSHPALEERQRNIKSKAEDYARKLEKAESYTPALDDASWGRLRALCPKVTVGLFKR